MVARMWVERIGELVLGAIVSCFDKEAGREALAPGTLGNVLVVYQDDGDAWDIPMNYRERAPKRLRLHATEIVRDGPRAALCHTYRIGNSTLRQQVVLVSDRCVCHQHFL